MNDIKIHFWTKPIDQILTRSLLSKFGEITDKDNLDNKMANMNIVIRDDLGQGKSRSISKFIMRDKERYNKDSYVITKCTYRLHI